MRDSYNYFKANEGMNWKRLLPFNFGKKSTQSVGTGGLRQVSLQPGSLLGYAVGFGSGIFNSSFMSDYNAMRFYRTSSAVATAVDIIAQEIEGIQPVVQKQDGLLDDTHPILDRLKMPNTVNESYSDFIGQLARNYLITHNGFIYSVGTSTRPPIELYAAKPQNISIYEAERDNYPDSFTATDGPATGHYSREFIPRMGTRFYAGNLRELWQIRGFSSRYDNRQADSPLLAICLDIWQHIRGRIHNVRLLENGARPTLIVTFKGEGGFDQEVHDARKEALQEQLAGADNAGKIIPISADDIDISEVGKSNKDMDYENLDRIASMAIYNRYRIPLPLVTMQASTFNNMETAVSHLYDFAVLPALRKLLSNITMMLAPRYGEDISKFSITYNPEEIPALKARRLKEIETRRSIGVETINEIRESLPNREPIEGGDTLYQPATMVPVGQDLFTDDNVTTTDEAERRGA